MRSKHLLRFVFSFFAALFVISAAHAQFQAAVQGTVTDSSGGAIVGAKVTLTDQATGVSRDANTGPNGFYSFPEVAPGAYTVTVAANGFKTSINKDINVSAEQPRGFDVKLDVGQVSENVTVSATTVPELQTENADVSGTITTEEIQRLPDFNRDPYELVRLSPGVFGDFARMGNGNTAGFPNGAGTNNGSGGPGGSNTAIFQVENQIPISANGQRVTSNAYYVDGVSVNSLQWGGAAVLTPSPDSVQQITVLANDYDATDGRNSGAHTKVVTQSGGNAFHGGLFFQMEDPNFNAFNKFGGYQQGTGFLPDVRNDDAFKQFGAHMGGPLIHNKLFWFFNYEGLRDTNTNYNDQWVETPQFRSTLAAARPNTPVAATLTAPGAAPRIAQVLAPSCSLWISASQPCAVVGTGVDIGSPGGSFGSYINPPDGGGLDGIPDLEFVQLFEPNMTQGNQYNARLDYVMGRSTFTVNTFLTYLNNTQADDAAESRPMADVNLNSFSPSGFLSWIFTVSPTWINEARFNFTRYGFDQLATNPNVDWAIPRTEIQGLPINGERIKFGAQQGDNTPAVAAQNTYSFRDMMTHIHNSQNWRFGVEWDHYQDNDNLLGGARPDYVFQQPWNFANGAPIFEQIEVNPLTGAASNNARAYRSSDIGLFFQDDWKLRPNLTVNLGLRWDYYGVPSEANGNLENIIPGTGSNGLLNAVAVLPKQMYNKTWRNIGPRLGFAWSPEALKSNMVVRGGFGIAYDRFDDVSFDNTRNNPPLVASYGICCGTSGSPFVNGQIVYELGSSTSDPRSYPSNPALATAINPATNLPIILSGQGAPSVWSNPVNMPVPYVYLYSLQMEYALPHKWVATLGYQGSASHHLLRIIDLKYFFPVPNSQINDVFTFTPDTNANFNALVSQLSHQFGAGFLLTLNYTFSKCIDQVSAEGPGFVTNQTYPIDDSTERGPCDYDATHYFRAYGLWDLPILRHRTDWAGKILGGWQANGIYTFHSGFPWTPVAQNQCIVLNANNLCQIRPSVWNVEPQINFSNDAFTPPISPNFSSNLLSQITLATLNPSTGLPTPPGVGRNSYRGPRYSDIDLSLMKQFGLPSMKVLGENSKIELRLNMYNAFNELNFAPFTFSSTSTTLTFGNNGSGKAIYNPLFGLATTSALSGRTLEIVGKFIF